ncbi:hypothetical protein Hanom_Chr09g00854901 [Helianthus anomalus]
MSNTSKSKSRLLVRHLSLNDVSCHLTRHVGNISKLAQHYVGGVVSALLWHFQQMYTLHKTFSGFTNIFQRIQHVFGDSAIIFSISFPLL